MKNVFLNIIRATFSFAKAHTAIAIATASAVVVTAVAVPVGVSIAKNDNIVSAEEIEIIEETIIIDKTDVSSENNSSVEDTTSVEESPVVSEPVKEPVTSKEEASATEQTTTSKPTQTTQPETPVKNPTPEAPSTPSDNKSDVNVVQRADPETGISWDGVSPIIYTYPDGATGTEPRDGATYEYLPGMTNTITETEHVEYDGKCSHCGKTEGDGSNGTCIRYSLIGHDMPCPTCGETIPVRTCHTCDE